MLNLAVIAAALIGVYVLGSEDDGALPPGTTVPPSSTVGPTVEQLLAMMPASPIDGKQSQRLPVAAVPWTDLVDGQFVTALGKGFLPGERVGAVLCVAEAALEGVAAVTSARTAASTMSRTPTPARRASSRSMCRCAP